MKLKMKDSIGDNLQSAFGADWKSNMMTATTMHNLHVTYDHIAIVLRPLTIIV